MHLHSSSTTAQSSCTRNRVVSLLSALGAAVVQLTIQHLMSIRNTFLSPGLREPVHIQVFRHYIFCLQFYTDEIHVFTIDYNQTWASPKPWTHVTKFISPSKIEYGFAVSTIGYVWYIKQNNGAFDKNVAVFKLPRDLTESWLPYKINDLREHCIELE